MIKQKCQICGKKKDVIELIPYKIWQFLCQSCYDRQINKNKEEEK